MRFRHDELRGIILGHNLSDEIVSFIARSINPEVVKMRTKVAFRSYQIVILPLFKENDLYNGFSLKTLDIEETLSKRKYVYMKSL